MILVGIMLWKVVMTFAASQQYERARSVTLLCLLNLEICSIFSSICRGRCGFLSIIFLMTSIISHQNTLSSQTKRSTSSSSLAVSFSSMMEVSTSWMQNCRQLSSSTSNYESQYSRGRDSQSAQQANQFDTLIPDMFPLSLKVLILFFLMLLQVFLNISS